MFIIGYVEGINKKENNNIKVVNKSLERQILYHKEVEKGSIVASKNGKKYYFAWCSGINRIKKENRIYFDTEIDAQNKGLTLSISCI